MGEADRDRNRSWAERYASVVVASLALAVSLSAYIEQRNSGLKQERSISAQQQSLDQQKEALRVQSEALDTQKRAVADAESRFSAEDPAFLLTPSLVKVAASGERSPVKTLLSKQAFEGDPTFELEIAVSNTGRNPGIVQGVWVTRTDDSDIENGPDQPVRILRKSLGYMTPDDFRCVDAGGVVAPCSWPLGLNAGGVLRVRADLTGYIAKAVWPCDKPGQISVTVTDAKTKRTVDTAFTVQTFRGCDPESQG